MIRRAVFPNRSYVKASDPFSAIPVPDHLESFFTVPADPLHPKEETNKSGARLFNPLPWRNKSANFSSDLQMHDCGARRTATGKGSESESNLASLSALLKACLSNGDLVRARSVFDSMPGKDVVAWTCMMRAYAQHEQGMEALEIFYQMHNQATIVPDMYSYACALEACAIASTLEDGRIIHSAIATSSSSSSSSTTTTTTSNRRSGANLHVVVVETALVGFYGKCGSVDDAMRVFEGVYYKDTICWNTMIAVLVQNNHDAEALFFSQRMCIEGIEPNTATYMHVLHACTDARTLTVGEAIHTAVVGAGYEDHKALNTALVNMYTRCGSLQLALKVFRSLSHHDSISWTAMISALSRHGRIRDALLCFSHMQSECIRPDNITFICIVDACAGLRAVKHGLQLHAAIVESEYAQDLALANSLLNMYIRCGQVHDARRAFDSQCFHDDLSWNTMLEALSDYGYHKEALSFFLQAWQRNFKLNKSSYACVINASTKLQAFEQGKMLHAGILESSGEHHLVIVSALINMYGKNGRLQDARNVFKMAVSHDVVCCNAMMTAFVHAGDFRDALNHFYEMEQMCLKLSNISFLCALEACSGLLSLNDGQKIHSVIVKKGRMHDIMVASALINMYGKCGSLSDARKIFENIPCKDCICCTLMIAALTENELHEEALEIFTYMMCKGINPDTITYVCILNACACITAVEVAFILHAAVTEMKINEDTLIGTGIMDVYGKGGAVEDASKVFSSFSDHDVGSWNAMLGVFAHNGNECEIKRFLKRFEISVFKPSCTTFISILVAFSHGGTVDDGWYLLHYMRNKHGLIPGIEHYICMVDLLGRAGRLNEAEILIDCMPFQRISIACRSMFSACIMHGNLEYGQHIARFCFELNGHSDSAYVMLSNMYAMQLWEGRMMNRVRYPL